jgi:hypothetical protein
MDQEYQKNGVLCWFYVYKKDKDKNDIDTVGICGIVIIKKFTQTNNKYIYFYSEIKMTSFGYGDNDRFIKDFINMPFTDEVAVNNFLNEKQKKKDIIILPFLIFYGGKTDLKNFLEDLMSNQFTFIKTEHFKTLRDATPAAPAAAAAPATTTLAIPAPAAPAATTATATRTGIHSIDVPGMVINIIRLFIPII